MSPISACAWARRADRPLRTIARRGRKSARDHRDQGAWRHAGVERVEGGPKGAVIALRGNRFANQAGLVELIQRYAGTLRLPPTRRSSICATGKTKRPASPALPSYCRRWSRSPAPRSPMPTRCCCRRSGRPLNRRSQDGQARDEPGQKELEAQMQVDASSRTCQTDAEPALPGWFRPGPGLTTIWRPRGIKLLPVKSPKIEPRPGSPSCGTRKLRMGCALRAAGPAIRRFWLPAPSVALGTSCRDGQKRRAIALATRKQGISGRARSLAD